MLLLDALAGLRCRDAQYEHGRRRHADCRHLEMDDLSVDRMSPMLLCEARQPWVAHGMGTELKLDGYRALVQVLGQSVEIRTRNGANATAWWPEIGTALGGLSKRRTILDGEVVVLDELGRSDFDRCHARALRRRWFPGADAVTFAAFDVLVLRGRDVRGLPWIERKGLLQQLLGDPRPSVMYVQHLEGEMAPALFEEANRLRLEGIVIKELNAPYLCGERSCAWTKVKRKGATPARRFTRGSSPQA